nr:uncharacterized protein LOC124498972 [Dermatophagoides farinae]
MERMREIQREHHQRSLQQLLLAKQQQQQQQPAVDIDKKVDNVYDTVADVIMTTNKSHIVDSSSSGYYNRPIDLPEVSNHSNLDMQRQDIEQWLDSMEQRLANISVNNNNQQSNGQNNGNKTSIIESKDFKSQLSILSDYESECNQYSCRLQTLCNSIDARIASLTPLKLNEKGQPQQQQQQQQQSSSSSSTSTPTTALINSNNISMPYYEHLIKLRKQASDMQCRSNYLYLCIKCKTRSLNELLSLTSSSSNRNLLMSMVNGGSSSGTELDNYGTQSSKKSSKSISSIKSSSITGGGSVSGGQMTTNNTLLSNDMATTATSQQQMMNQSSSANNNYSLHEQSEKRFNKWLAEMEQSLDFIEKGLAAESALININQDGSITNFNTDDTALYSNVSEMQQMHMNYYEKIKIIQREIEQKRTDHRLLMELLENLPTNDSKISATTTASSSSSIGNRQQQQQQSIDPWLIRFRNRVEQTNSRWNSVRLRVLTLRSRLESSSFVSKSTTTTCPVPVSHSTASLYSVIQNNNVITGGGIHNNDNESIMATNTANIAYNVVINERATQLVLSLRELTEWIIKRQMEFQQKQQISHYSDGGDVVVARESKENVPLDIANVLQQKSSLLQLRNQLIEKRPIIDSSLLSCHNFLRRLGVKRAHDVQRFGGNARMSASASMASSIAGSSIINNDQQQQQRRQQQNGQQIEKLEISLNREMNKLLELWHSVQSTVDLGLQRLDEAHLRLTDLQRVMDDLAAKLHEAEMVKSKWTPISNITFDDLPQQRSQLKTYNQMYVAPVSRDVIHVNEIAARLTGRNVPLSHGNLKSLEEVTTRARLLRVAIDERSRELDQIQHDHGTAQQHFLTEAVDEPWERAVTNNKLPCYINRQTETVHLFSPRYTEIIDSMNEYNEVRYAAYRTAMKLRRLQIQLGLNNVNLNNLANAFEQHGVGPNGGGGGGKNKSTMMKNDKSTTNSNDSSANNNNDNNAKNNKQESTTTNNHEDGINDELPYELRLIAVPDIVSCLKQIFETAEMERQQQHNKQERTSSSNKKQQQSSATKDKENSKTMANNNNDDHSKSSLSTSTSSSSSAAINVPLCVDLCLNWLLDLYDAPSRAGFIRQFSFQVALVLLSHISLEQKYIYLFNLIADENQRADERRFGLLIYDCLRLPKLLGEVAAFGGTNVEPSVRSCLEMASASGLRPPNGSGITVDQVLAWIRAEPQSLVWLVVLHRLRLAESSRHPAKCNSCRQYPIQGFRYRCLKCFNFDLCQYCFLSVNSVKKHKPSHPMQEYCVATTSKEDMRDFSKILRNKFKSGRYFKRHQALGYLPVQSLHEGDRLVAEESAPSFVHTLHGSYSHAPSSNTTPVHTLSYPQRAASPGSMTTKRDLDFMVDSRFVQNNNNSLHQQQQQQQHHYTPIRPGPLPPLPVNTNNTVVGIYGTRPIHQQKLQQLTPRKQLQTSAEHHHHQLMAANQSPLSGHRITPTTTITSSTSSNTVGDHNQFVRMSPSRSSLKSNDDIHQRLGKYANRLAELEHQQQRQNNQHQLLNRSESLRSGRASRSSRFDSLPPVAMQAALHQLPPHHPHRRSSLNHPTAAGGGGGERHHNQIMIGHHQQQQKQFLLTSAPQPTIQSPTEMLSKIAADQRNELEIIIQRLQEENRLLTNEYSQLKDKDDDDDNYKNKSSNDPTTTKRTTIKNESINNNNNTMETKSKTINNQIELNDKSIMTNGSGRRSGNNKTDLTPSPTSSSQASPNSPDNNNTTTITIADNQQPQSTSLPSFWLDEVRRLKNDRNHLETRKFELEKCNKLLELQLNQFKTYINTTGTLDERTKQKLENRIQEAEKLLDEQQQQQQQQQLSDQNRDDSSSSIKKLPKNQTTTAADILKFDDDDGYDDENKESNKSIKNSQLSSTTYHQPLLHTAADRINNAMESLVDVLNQNDNNNDDDDRESSTNGHFKNGKTTTTLSMTNGQQQQQSSAAATTTVATNKHSSRV